MQLWQPNVKFQENSRKFRQHFNGDPFNKSTSTVNKTTSKLIKEVVIIKNVIGALS